MSFKKIKTGFNGLTDSAALKIGADVKKGMPDNPFFPTLTVPVEQFITAYEELLAAIPATQLRNKIAISVRDAKRDTFNLHLFRLAYGVMSVAYGNDEAIESSGFPTLTGTTTARPIPSKPTKVEAIIAVQPNTIQVTCDYSKDAAIYEAEVHSMEGVRLGGNTDTSTKVMVTGIQEGILVNARMRLKNAAGEGNWSDPVMTRIPLPNEPRVKFM